jgi:hypothetical protein
MHQTFQDLAPAYQQQHHCPPKGGINEKVIKKYKCTETSRGMITNVVQKNLSPGSEYTMGIHKSMTIPWVCVFLHFIYL